MMEKKPKRMTLSEKVERLEKLVDSLVSEVYMASSTDLSTGITKMYLKGRVDALENKT